MSTPLVSVFMPTFNQVDYVAEALLTAVEQDYPNVQAVVTDDGSTDGTRDVVAALAARYPERITAILGEHVGLAGNCNRGLEACRGKYIACTSGDDVFLPGKLARQVAWFEEDERRAVCGHDVTVFDSDSGTTLYEWSDYFPLSSGRGASRLVSRGQIFAGVSIMARATVMKPHRYDDRFGLMCDWKFWIDALACSGGHYGFVDGVYARYRRHVASITMDASNLPGRMASLLMTLGAVEGTYPQLVGDCRFYRANAFLKLGGMHLRLGDAPAARQYLWSALRADPFVSWKASAALLLSAAPSSVRHAVLSRYVSPTKI
jgi:glycosyltransferase involved in cell wall biosynthesis